MRREGKLYSWEDQKWDAEMRREMESKRKRQLLEGGEGREKDMRVLVKEAKLSQKQKVNSYKLKLKLFVSFKLCLCDNSTKFSSKCSPCRTTY